MNIPLFFGLVTLLALTYIWIGNRASKELNTSDDYFLMGRSLTFFPLFLTLLATQLGGGTLLGAAQEAYQKGWLVIFYPLGACLGLFTLAIGFGGKLRKLNISTVAELFETIYKSKSLRYTASLLSIIALFFILVAQGTAARLIFSSMGAQNPYIFLIFWLVLVAYTVMGGLKAVVNTDMLQAIFILATLVFAFFSVDVKGATSNIITTGNSIATMSDIPWTTWLFMPLLFMLIEQDMAQRCFAAKNPRVITFSAFAAGTTLLFSSLIAIYFGVMAKDLGLTITGNSSILIQSVEALTNPSIATLFMVAILLAVISTADSLLCSIGSNLSCDFLATKTLSEKKRVQLSKVLTLITGLLALVATYYFNNVVSLLMLSYELSVCLLIVPIIAAVISKKPSFYGASFSIAVGAAGFIFFRLFETPLPREVLTITLSSLSYFLASKLPAKKEVINLQQN